MPTVLSIQVALPQELPADDETGPWARLWTTGFQKQPVTGPVWLGRTNLVGDRQADLEHHGGIDKAVNAYPAEHYPYWRNQLGLPLVDYGAFGENFTISGLVESEVCIGDVYRLGPAVVQISQPRQPCWKLARRWQIKNLAAQVQATGRTGWYFRVLEEGEVSAGLALELVERPHPEFTIDWANQVMHHNRHDLAAAASFAACPALSASWREHLAARR